MGWRAGKAGRAVPARRSWGLCTSGLGGEAGASVRGLFCFFFFCKSLEERVAAGRPGGAAGAGAGAEVEEERRNGALGGRCPLLLL